MSHRSFVRPFPFFLLRSTFPRFFLWDSFSRCTGRRQQTPRATWDCGQWCFCPARPGGSVCRPHLFACVCAFVSLRFHSFWRHRHVWRTYVTPCVNHVIQSRFPIGLFGRKSSPTKPRHFLFHGAEWKSCQTNNRPSASLSYTRNEASRDFDFFLSESARSFHTEALIFQPAKKWPIRNTSNDETKEKLLLW